MPQQGDIMLDDYGRLVMYLGVSAYDPARARVIWLDPLKAVDDENLPLVEFMRPLSS